jgi:hypothetical protein
LAGGRIPEDRNVDPVIPAAGDGVHGHDPDGRAGLLRLDPRGGTLLEFTNDRVSDGLVELGYLHAGLPKKRSSAMTSAIVR